MPLSFILEAEMCLVDESQRTYTHLHKVYFKEINCAHMQITKGQGQPACALLFKEAELQRARNCSHNWFSLSQQHIVPSIARAQEARATQKACSLRMSGTERSGTMTRCRRFRSTDCEQPLPTSTTRTKPSALCCTAFQSSFVAPSCFSLCPCYQNTQPPPLCVSQSPCSTPPPTPHHPGAWALSPALLTELLSSV